VRLRKERDARRAFAWLDDEADLKVRRARVIEEAGEVAEVGSIDAEVEVRAFDASDLEKGRARCERRRSGAGGVVVAVVQEAGDGGE
jgi:hypothetical protein